MSPTPQRLDEIAKSLRGIADELSPPTQPAKPTNPTPTTSSSRKLILNEQFDGSSLHPRWRLGRATTASGGHPGYNTTEKGYYLPNRQRIENNTLILEALNRSVNVVNNKARQGQFTSGDTEDIWYSNGDSGVYGYQTGTVTTAPDLYGMINGLARGDWTPQPAGFEFLYGLVEGRIKVPKGKGLWPAFWLLQSNGIWPPEIDILEVVDPTATRIAQHYHYGQQNTDFTKYEGPGYPTNTDMSQDFHIYAVDWQPSYIRWYIDGKLTQEFMDKAQIPNKPMYILLNLAVGGDWPGNPDASTKFPARMEVDYVKVWQ